MPQILPVHIPCTPHMPQMCGTGTSTLQGSTGHYHPQRLDLSPALLPPGTSAVSPPGSFLGSEGGANLTRAQDQGQPSFWLTWHPWRPGLRPGGASFPDALPWTGLTFPLPRLGGFMRCPSLGCRHQPSSPLLLPPPPLLSPSRNHPVPPPSSPSAREHRAGLPPWC